MEENLSYEINYNDMKKIIQKYYELHGRNVGVSIRSEIDTDRFAGMVITNISVTERASIAGIETNGSFSLSIDDLKEILDFMLEQEDKTLINVTDNAITTTKIEGAYMGEHQVTRIVDKTFTVIAKPKVKARGKRS